MYLIEVSSSQIAYVYDAWQTPHALVGIFSAFDAKKVIALLNKERNRNPMPAKVFLSKPRRVVYRDVACRYIRLHGGKSEWQPTGPDTGYPILIGSDGEERAEITMFDRYPSASTNLDGMPF